MPNYVYECQSCFGKHEAFRKLSEFAERIVAACPFCKDSTEQHLVVTPPAFEDWDNNGEGRWFEHLSPKGMTFHGKQEYKDYLKQHGLREWEPKPGMPSDGRG